jgi:hypothetical protein
MPTTIKSLNEGMYLASCELFDLCNADDETGLIQSNDLMREADDFRYACPECGRLELENDPEDGDNEMCEACLEAHRFTCTECDEECDVDDRDERYPTLCTSCGDDHYSGLCEAYRDEITSVLDGWGEDDDELAKLKKVLAYVKRLTR